MSERGEPDPTETSRLRPLFRLLGSMDDEIARVYAEDGIDDLKSTWVMEILRLNAHGPMTIAELARSVGRTHSAMSQKVAAMRAAGWVSTGAGPDARSKEVALTPKAEKVVGKLAAEWRATEASIAEIEAEIPYPLSRMAEDLRQALCRKSFHDRIMEKLGKDPSWRNSELLSGILFPMLHEPRTGSGEDHASRTGPWRRPLLALLPVAVLAIIITIYRQQLDRSLHVLATANPAWLLLALAAEAASLTAFGLSRRRLLRANGHRVSLRSVMAITYAGNALSTSVPLAGTELAVVYSYRQFRRAGVNAATTSWSLTVSWICSTSALALLVVAGAVAGGATAASAAGFAGAALYLLPGAGLLLALRFDRVRGVLHAVLAWLAGRSKRMFGKPENGAGGLDRFLGEVSSTRLPLPGYAWVFVLAIANWAFDCATLACAIEAMGQPVPWGDLLLVYGAGAAAGSTGVTPGGFGIVELALTATLTASGLHSPGALASVLAYRLVNFWLVLLGGWITMGFLTHPLRMRRPGRRLGPGRRVRGLCGSWLGMRPACRG